MAVRVRSVLKGWFSAGKYPTASQFAHWLDSFLHKSEDGLTFEDNGDVTFDGTVYVNNLVKQGTLSTNRSFYIAPESGEDSSEADGSEASPYQSLRYALLQLPAVVTSKVFFYFTEAATVEIDQETLNLLVGIAWSKNPIIEGYTELLIDDFETSGFPDENNTFVMNAYSNGEATGWEEDAYKGCLVKYNDDNFGILGSHGESELKSPKFSEGYTGTEIHQLSTILYFTDNRIDPNVMFSPGRVIKIKYCQIINASGNNLQLLSDTVSLVGCSIKPGSSLSLKGNPELSQCYVYTETTDNTPLIKIRPGNKASMIACIFEHTSPDSLTTEKPCIHLQNDCTIEFMQNYISGFPVGIKYHMNAKSYALYGHYRNHFENIGVLFSLVGSNCSHLMGEYYGTHNIRVFSYNYIFALNGGTDLMHFVFREDQFIGDEPTEGVFVPSTGGVWKENETLLTAKRDDLTDLTDRNNNFYVINLLE